MEGRERGRWLAGRGGSTCSSSSNIRSAQRSSLSLMFLDFVRSFGSRGCFEVGWFGCLPQMITAGCLAGVSDSVAQKLSGYQKIEKCRLLLKMVRTLTLHLVSGTYRCSHRGGWIFPCSFIGGNRSFSYIRLGPVDGDILICNVLAIP
jgi:hypothetical protein